MWSGGISKRNPVRPAGKWAQGLTCQTAKTPACHIEIVIGRFFHLSSVSSITSSTTSAITGSGSSM